MVHLRDIGPGRLRRRYYAAPPWRVEPNGRIVVADDYIRKEIAALNRATRILPGLLSLLACFAPQAWSQDAPAPAAPPAPQADAPRPPATTTVVFTTAMGDIHIAVETERAPVTAANFLRYVDNKRFDGITFYRAHKVSPDGKYAIVQGGLQGLSSRVFKPIAHESPQVTKLSHLDGAISMAREAPGTATADFFIVVGDLVSMDGKPDGSDPGYAVFGRVVSGMDVVRAMLELPRSEDARNPVMKGQMLAAPVKVVTARRAP
jgi:peptidyl-prolyl cis-trans isomerase A (cyclophilin A)